MDELRQRAFPYCIQRLADGRYILLNRRYKPLGWPGATWVDYEAHPSAVKIRVTTATARKLSYQGSTDTDAIYLYNDGCVPTRSAAHMRAYLARLAVLMKLRLRD
jgi:hypothetical protein